VATKGGKRVAAKKGKTPPARRVGKTTPSQAKGARGTKSVVASKGQTATKPQAPSSRPVTPRGVLARGLAQPSPLERAERLRDAIEQSKLSAADPWVYAAKARAWRQRAQQLVDEIARSGDTPALQRGLATLAAEVEGDRDFQEARRRA